MGFFSFLGRVLFASIFILSAWQMFNDFGEDGGPAAKEFAPKLAILTKKMTGLTGKRLVIDDKIFTAVCLALKGLGGLLFVFGSSYGAYLLMAYLFITTPLLFDFYNYEFGGEKFFGVLEEFLQYAALFGALMFFLGMKSSIGRKLARKKTTKPKVA